jgi:hypothetical protein
MLEATVTMQSTWPWFYVVVHALEYHVHSFFLIPAGGHRHHAGGDERRCQRC